MATMPLVMRLPRRALQRKDVIRVLAGRLDVPQLTRAAIVSAFAFKDDELPFARALAEHTNLWIYRVNQRAFAGDFIVVDLSSPQVNRRFAIALDLKRGARRVREGRRGVQMSRSAAAIASLVTRGVLAPDHAPIHLVGDAATMSTALFRVLARARTSPLPKTLSDV